jgi:hypothetical protein
VFMAGYHYRADGRPIWFTSSGRVINNVYTGPAFDIRNGQTISGPYRAPSPATEIGQISLNVSNPNSITMRWMGGETRLVPQIFGSATPRNTIESGWWWDMNASGSGYSIEMQGGKLFAVAFFYDDAGNPIWYYSAGDMQSPTRYTGEVLIAANGQAPNGPYRAPTLSAAGSLSVEFSGPNTGVVTLPNGRRVNITRMRYGSEQ